MCEYEIDDAKRWCNLGLRDTEKGREPHQDYASRIFSTRQSPPATVTDMGEGEHLCE